MPKVFVGPYQTGLQKNVEPMFLPNEAYETIEDMYVWRGRTRKKQGYKLLGRLNNYGATAVPIAAGNIATGASTFGAASFAAGDLPLSPGSVTITITVGVALWPAVMTFQDNGNGTLTCTDAAIAGGFTLAYGVIDYISGQFDLFIDPIMPAGGPFAVAITAFRHLPQLSVMGLSSYEQPAINREVLIAFDEDFSYEFNTATNTFDPLLDSSAGNPVRIWSGSDSNFFWCTNYYVDNANNNLFWATNNVANTGVAPAMVRDGISIYNGTFWYAQTPPIDAAANQLRGCLLLVPYRGRMVALNTLEGAIAPAGATRYSNRARWSQIGVPYTTGLGGFDATAWRSDIVGKGGFIDCPTREAIVSCAFNKDTLIVFFETSTWQLRYVGSPLPFIWEQIDTDLGSESTFSTVYFDKGVLSVGDKGIIAAQTTSIERVDSKIPDIVFNIQNDTEGPTRVHGIRDFYSKMVYWCYPDDDQPAGDQSTIFPGRILALNYDEGSYSIFHDTFTCFGYFQTVTDYTWATLEYKTWEDWTVPWGSPKGQSYFPDIVGGNHKGFVEILNKGATNSPYSDLNVSIAIPNSISNAFPPVVQVNNHTLETGQFVKIYGTRGFEEIVTAEAVGTAEAGVAYFTGTLANLGIFPASEPTVGGPTYISIQVGANDFTDIGDGTLRGGTTGGTINYETGRFTVNFAALGADTPVTANYSYNILNYRVFYVERLSENTFSLYTIDPNNDTPQAIDLSGYAAYTGWGEIAQVSNFKLRTKRFNPFLEEAASVRMNYFDLLLSNSDMTFLSKTLADQDNSHEINVLNVSCQPESGSGLAKEKLWKRVYANAVSDFVQLEFGLSNSQMLDEDNYASNLVLYSMSLDLDKAGRNINRS